MKPLDKSALALQLRTRLDKSLRDHLHELDAHRVPAHAATCCKGGFELDVVVFAQHGAVVFFASPDALMFGIGELTAAGAIADSLHYPNVTMATRAFLGRVRADGAA